MKPMIDQMKILIKKNLIDTNQKSLTAQGSVPGYYPLREEFEVEYDNEAELLISNLEIYPDESAESLALKKQIMEMFCV